MNLHFCCGNCDDISFESVSTLAYPFHCTLTESVPPSFEAEEGKDSIRGEIKTFGGLPSAVTQFEGHSVIFRCGMSFESSERNPTDLRLLCQHMDRTADIRLIS